jgi:glycosyltransferase involved in cell wall biosynthesis
VSVENLSLPRGVPGWFHLRLAEALVRRTLAFRPDVVHAFKPKAYAGLAHRLLAWRPHRPPVVVDSDDWEGPGGWNDLNPYPAPLKRFFAWQERWGLRRGEAVTVASRALESLAWAQGGAAERVFYLPNGFAWPHPPVEPRPHPRPTLLLYTRFFEFDLERLWRVVAAVRRARPAARLYVVGEGLFGEEERLLRRAREAGWRVGDGGGDAEADLCYAGYVPLAEQPRHFAGCDLALYPFDDSLVNRTKCPVKLLDLLAAGLPVVAEEVGQIGEVIQPGETGLLVPPGDEEAFAGALLALLDAPERRRGMGQAAAADVRARFSWSNLAEIAERAYAYARRGLTGAG